MLTEFIVRRKILLTVREGDVIANGKDARVRWIDPEKAGEGLFFSTGGIRECHVLNRSHFVLRVVMLGSQQSQSGAEHSTSQSASSKPGGAAAIPQDPPTPGHRHIYLVSQCYQPGRSHWSLWIPSLPNPLIGRVIHVRGSVIRGFAVEFKDNHKFDDRDSESELYQFTHLGEVPATSLVDSHDGPRVEGDVRDDYDIAAYALELPARDSINAPEPLDDPIWNRPHPRFERCQEWTRRLIADLVADGKLPRSAIQAMDTATSYTDEKGTHFAYNRFSPPYGI